MDFNATIDLIIKDLDEASRIIDDLRNYPGVPELHVEIAKAKCKSAGEVIALLKNPRLSPHGEVPFEEKKAPLKTFKARQADEEPEKETVKDTVKEPVKETIKEPVKETVKETIKEAVKEPENIAAQDDTQKAASLSSILADTFTNLHASINEQLGTGKNEEDVTKVLKSKHIHSLKDAIGVNDRFLFIREIFDGKKGDYEQAIEKLEKSESVADAKAVIISYTGKNTGNEAVKELLDLVKRKLTPDE
jgi:hypothetical protein